MPKPEEQKSAEEQKSETTETFTQADVDRIVADRLKREREATKAKFADYEELKEKAGEATTLEERIAAMEKRAQDAEIAALRAQYATDVPEKLRPLLTGTTEEELKAQRDLIAEGETERKKNGNRVPKEGTSTSSSPNDNDEMRDFARSLFATSD